MATISDANRKRITAGLMRYWSSLFEMVSGLSESELRLAIDATDDWIEANQVNFDQALPLKARNNLTLAQKTLIFCAVATFRVSKQFAVRLLGEVD